MKKRAALACALYVRSDILILDEPTNHLDFSAIEFLENYLKGDQNQVQIPPYFSTKSKFTTAIDEFVTILITTSFNKSYDIKCKENINNNTILTISFIVEDGYRWHAEAFEPCIIYDN